MSVLCKAASLPASNIAPIEVPFRGRIFKVAGDRTFDTWTLTVINDTDFAIRNSFESWMQVIAQMADASGDTNPEDYQRTAVVQQFTRQASALGDVTGAGLEVSESSINSTVFSQLIFLQLIFLMILVIQLKNLQ